MRLGIYGGSFDPVHYGHLLLAESCREQAALDEVWFMPAAVPPHKRQASMASPKQRVEMLELALAGHAAFRVSTLEIDRGGVSYTVDTVRTIHEQRPGDELFLLMGADTLVDLPNWREPAAILELALPLAVVRRGATMPSDEHVLALVSPERRQQWRALQIDMPILELSATEIRARVSARQSIRYRTPRAVEKYIETHGLYQ
jgi:nicotinate-nucleotide adenylyltransferase